MSVLADTSIWIEYFRGQAGARALDSLLEQNQVLVCGPVLAELLAGTAPEQADALWLAIGSLPSVAVDESVWRQAGERSAALRRSGGSVPLLDVVIAVLAVRAEAALWTRDRDFERVREALPELRLHEPRS